MSLRTNQILAQHDQLRNWRNTQTPKLMTMMPNTMAGSGSRDNDVRGVDELRFERGMLMQKFSCGHTVEMSTTQIMFVPGTF